MTAPTEVEAVVGARLYISATLPTTYDATGFQSTDIVWTEVNQVDNIGNHGGTKSVASFIPVNTGTVAKVGGSVDYGKMSVSMGNLAGDTGQQLLRTALGQKNVHYSVKLQYDDGNAVTDEVHYFSAVVSKFENQDGDANAIRKIACELDISSEIIVIAPT